MSRLIWIYAVCKNLLLLSVAVKELSRKFYMYNLLLLRPCNALVESCLKCLNANRAQNHCFPRVKECHKYMSVSTLSVIEHI